MSVCALQPHPLMTIGAWGAQERIRPAEVMHVKDVDIC